MDGGTFTWIASPDGALETDIPSWRDLTGQAAEELLGDGWLTALHPEDRPRVAAEWQEALRAKRPYAVTYRIGTRDGDWRHFAVHGVPVVDDHDVVLRFVGMGQDVTDRELDRELLQEVVERTPVALAVTWGPSSVYRVVNEAYRELLPPGRDPVGLSVAEAIPETEAAPFFAQVRETGEPLRFTEYPVPWGGDAALDGNRYYDYSLHPLPGHDGIGGVLIVAVETTEQVRRSRDLERRLEEERRVAETLQRALLPPAPALAGLEIVVRYLPGGPQVQVGGDWYDAFEIPDGRVAIVVGDIAGRGVEAARLMSQVRAAVRAYGLDGHGPAGVLERVERFFAGQDLADMATLLYAELSADRRILRWVSAGHPPALLAEDGGVRLVEGGLAPPVGAGAGRPTQIGCADIAIGSLLLLYTDGLVEDRRRPLEHGLSRLLEAAAGAAVEGPAAVCDAALAGILESGERHDDVALLAVRVTS